MSRALVIVDHGSRRPEAHAHLEWIAEQVRQRAPELVVRIAHMELAEPSVEQVIGLCAREGATEIAVHPLFLAPGRHLSEDVPALIERAAAANPGVAIRLLAALGTRSALADVILETLARSD